VDGLVYCWGRNNSYQCGNGSNTFNVAPIVVEKLKGKQVSQIACGNSHSVAVTDNDEVYVWGSNCYYQLSIVHYKTPDLVRSPFLEGKRISRVACGANFTTLLTGNVT
jgi:alpha-tubulin suppressor-like RCC1 family protein